MKRCIECGRPIALCNAFALNRLATESLARGNAEQAVQYASAAIEALRDLPRDLSSERAAGR